MELVLVLEDEGMDEGLVGEIFHGCFDGFQVKIFSFLVVIPHYEGQGVIPDAIEMEMSST